MRWESLGSGVYSPVAVSPGPGSLTVLGRSSASELLRADWRDGAWDAFESLGLPVALLEGSAAIPVEWPLAACGNSRGLLHLFARGPDGELLHMHGDGDPWTRFQYLGAPAAVSGTAVIPMGLAGPPAACSRGAELVDVFVVGQNGGLLHTACERGEWTEFESLGAPSARLDDTATTVPLSGPLAACSFGGRLAVFLRGHAGDLVMKCWDGTVWGGFESLGSPGERDPVYPAVTFPTPLAGPPTVCSWGPDRIDVFARGIHGDALHRVWNGEYWSEFQSLGMPVQEGPSGSVLPFTGVLTACSWGPGRLDVFGRAIDGQLYHAWWDGDWDHDEVERHDPGRRLAEPEGARYSVTSCDLRMLMDQPTESIPPHNLPQPIRRLIRQARVAVLVPRHGEDGAGCNGRRTRPTPTAAAGLRI